MRVRPVPLTMTVLAVLLLSAFVPVMQATDHETFTLAGVEFPAGCTPPTLICYEVVRGDPQTDIRAGAKVKVTLTAAGEAPHNINVIEESNSDPNHLDTDVSQAIASSSTASSGLSTMFEFEAPAEGTVLYFWCDILEHEIAGMWFTATVGAPLEEPPTNNTTSGPTTQNETDPDDGGNETVESANGTAAADVSDPAGNATAEGSATADGNATVQGSDGDAAVEEDAPAVFGLLGLIAAAMVASRARRSA